jgi:hypothetical protein
MKKGDLYGEVDQVIIMTSNPGTSDFQPFTLGKVSKLRELLNQDGISHVPIAASAVFAHPDGPAAAVAAFHAVRPSPRIQE